MVNNINIVNFHGYPSGNNLNVRLNQFYGHSVTNMSNFL